MSDPASAHPSDLQSKSTSGIVTDPATLERVVPASRRKDGS